MGKKLEEILINHFVPRNYIEQALQEQAVIKKPLGEILLQKSLVNPEVLARCMAEQTGIEHFSIFTSDIQQDLDVDMDFVRENEIVPVSVSNGNMRVGMLDPTDMTKRDAVARYIKQKFGKQAEILIISADTFQRYIESRVHIGVLDIEAALRSSEDKASEGLRLLLLKAVLENCSDVHVQPTIEGGRIRLSRNGIFEPLTAIDKNQYQKLTNLIRMHSGITSLDKTVPQDGRIEGGFLKDERYGSTDFRVSIIPAGNLDRPTDSIVIRVLSRKTSILPLEDLGMSRQVLDFLNTVKKKPYGMIIFTGPTGSGKTTTIYSAMATINGVEKNVTSVEDPIEYRHDLWTQIQVREKYGFTFPEALKHLLRHAPNIIFCGEIRDDTTAKIAFEMANTGHLVFTTLHANDSITAIPRLEGLGVPRSLIESTILGILAQRLVRILCACKKSYNDPEYGTVYRSMGCPACNHTGYRKRAMVAEYFPFPRVNKQTIDVLNAAFEGNIFAARDHLTGLVSDMRADALEKVRHGITSIEEMERVV